MKCTGVGPPVYPALARLLTCQKVTTRILGMYCYVGCTIVRCDNYITLCYDLRYLFSLAIVYMLFTNPLVEDDVHVVNMHIVMSRMCIDN